MRMTISSNKKDYNGGLNRLNKNKRSKSIFVFWIMSLMLCGFLFFINFVEIKSFISLNKISTQSKVFDSPEIRNHLNGYLINTPGCRIPEMNPFDSSIKKFVFKPKSLECDKEKPPLFESNLTSIFLIARNLPYYNITSLKNFHCCYKEFFRKTPAKGDSDNQIKYNEACIPINTSKAIPVDGEYLQVICRAKHNKIIYEDYFAFVPMKKQQNFPVKSSPAKPNILIMGLDAISRINFHRQFPLTFKYLIKDLAAVELLGYNKVADNTFPNLIPLLTGMFESELQKSCWPSMKSHFDNCSFIWHNYSRNYYTTAFGEDCSWMGLFNYQRRGFINQPTDYYFSSFNAEIEANIGRNKDFNCKTCIGKRESYKVTLNYIDKFVTRMELVTAPYFAFFWSSALSHDYLNRPRLGDPSYCEFIKKLKEEGHLENTIFILMSDHGIRWGDIRQTYQGQMEERLPFVFITLPNWFKREYPDAALNLKRNIRRLTTPFDLHETLNHLLNLTSLSNKRSLINEVMSRGYSLFTEIPINRTCESAAIESHWCTCQQSSMISTNDTQVINAAEFAVDYMNKQLKGYAQCANLVLDNILSSRILYYNSEHITDKHSIKDYTINLKTSPGEGIFEVTVRYKEEQEKISSYVETNSSVTVRYKEEEQEKVSSYFETNSSDNLWSKLSITGTVSRLNLYGDQSYCITDFHLKLYCYCRSILNI